MSVVASHPAQVLQASSKCKVASRQSILERATESIQELTIDQLEEVSSIFRTKSLLSRTRKEGTAIRSKGRLFSEIESTGAGSIGAGNGKRAIPTPPPRVHVASQDFVRGDVNSANATIKAKSRSSARRAPQVYIDPTSSEYASYEGLPSHSIAGPEQSDHEKTAQAVWMTQREKEKDTPIANTNPTAESKEGNHSDDRHVDLDDITTAKRLPAYKRFFGKIRIYLDRHYILTSRNPDLVFPKAPSDEEKYCYIDTHRFKFLSLGLFAFLAASAGLWLFTLCSPYFYWYGPVAALLQLHISISYFVGLTAKDFNLKNHKAIKDKIRISEKSLPSVDVYLPVCKESLGVLENTWNHVKKLQYDGVMKIWVLDDGAQSSVKDLAASFDFGYICRDDRPYFRKAGNLRHAFGKTSADLFVIFDADFCPRYDFVEELVPRMMDDPEIAIIQTPQYFKTRKENTWVERGASEIQELFYRWTQINRDRYGASICVGTNAMYRRSALKEAGGTALAAASEDVHTGFYAVTHGWKLRYIPLCLAAGMSPDNAKACFSQQIRWSQGSTSLLLNGSFHRAKLGFMMRACFLSGMLYYWTTSIAMFTVPLPGLLIVWVRPNLLRYYNLAFALPSIIYGLLIFKFWAYNSHSLATEQIHVLQAYAYLFGIKDRILGKTHEWVASGSSSPSDSATGTQKKKQKSFSSYEQARLTACIWTTSYQGAFWAGAGYRLYQNTTVKWFDILPQAVLYAFGLYVTLPFLLSPSR